jgi:hypothetical protein
VPLSELFAARSRRRGIVTDEKLGPPITLGIINSEKPVSFQLRHYYIGFEVGARDAFTALHLDNSIWHTYLFFDLCNYIFVVLHWLQVEEWRINWIVIIIYTFFFLRGRYSVHASQRYFDVQLRLLFALGCGGGRLKGERKRIVWDELNRHPRVLLNRLMGIEYLGMELGLLREEEGILSERDLRGVEAVGEGGHHVDREHLLGALL